MATFSQMQADMQLLGMANLLNTDFGNLINKVQREEVESYPWSFLFQEVTVYGSVPITAGTITLTSGIVQTGTGTNWPRTEVAGIGTSTVPDNVFFLWVGPTLTTPFPVLGIPNSTTLYLAGYAGIPQTNVPYILQQLYFPVSPLLTVYRVRQIDNLVETSRAELDGFDPSRIATGGTPSLRWAMAPFSAATTFTFITQTIKQTTDPTQPMIELWPRTSQSLPYIVDGKIGPATMVNTTDQPQIPSQVIEAKAMMYACRALYASSGNPKWQTMADAYKADYEIELEKAKWEDSKRITPKGITSWGGRRLFDLSIDANHDLDGPPDFSTN